MFISDKFVFMKDALSEPKSMHSLAKPTSHVISIKNSPIYQGIMSDNSVLNLFIHAFHFGCCPN